MTQPNTPTLNTQTARDALALIRDHHVLVAIPQMGGKAEGLEVNVSDPASWQRAHDWMTAKQAARWNIYFHPNAVRPGLSKKAQKTDIVACDWVQSDIDPTKGKPYDVARSEAWQTVEGLLHGPTPPTLIFDSGNGFYPLWRLSEPVDVDTYDTANNAWNASHGVGGTFNADRILKLPGTIAYSNQKKLDDGYPETSQSGVVYVNGAILSVDTFKAVGAAYVPPKRQVEQTQDAAFVEAPLDPLLIARVVDMRAKDDRFDKHMGSGNDDKSGALWGIANKLAKAGFTSHEFAAVVGQLSEDALDHCERADVNYTRALRRAWDAARADMAAHLNALGPVRLPDTTTPVPVPPNRRSVREGEYVTVDGKLRWCLATAVAILECHDDWADVLAFNDFTGEIVICRPIPSSDGRGFQAHHMTDLDVAHAESWFNRIGFHNAKETTIRRAMVKVAHQNVIDPVRHYLEDLRWDGVPRLNKWLTTYAGAPDNFYTNEMGRCMLVGAVARVLQPGCKVDTMPILEGPQGINKSQMLRVLAGDEYFGDSLPPLKDKDAADYLAGLWFVEMAELDMMNRATMETTKSFLARQDDRFRPAYARDKIKRPRRCIFVGTTNQDNYLRDETGNRRFWPVQVTRINLEALRTDRDQIWAEAVATYHQRPVWWLEGIAEQLATGEQKKRNEDDPWTSDVLGYVESKHEVSIREILKLSGVVTKSDLTRGDSNRVAGILKAHGWKRDGLITNGTFRNAAKYIRR